MNQTKIPLVEHQIEDVRLENGCRIISVQIPSIPLSQATLWVGAGSRFDPRGKLGISHFVEHLMFMRTKMRSRTEQQMFLEERGIYANAVTVRDTVDYHFTFLPDLSQNVIELILDGLNNPIFTPEDVNREREVVLNEIRENDESPSSLLYKEINYATWGKDGLGALITGTEDSVVNFTINDCQTFVEDCYKGSNLTFVLINIALSTDKLKEIIGSLPALVKPSAGVGFSGSVYEHGVYVPFDMETIELELRFLTGSYPKTAKERAVNQMIVLYFAGGFLGRFNKRLRFIDPVTYWVNHDRTTLKDTSYCSFGLSTDPEKIKQAVEVMFEEIEIVKKGNLSNTDVDLFKPTLRMGLVGDSIDINELYDWYGFWPTMSGSMMTQREYLEAIDKVSAADVIEYVRKYFVSENQVLAHVGKEKVL